LRLTGSLVLVGLCVDRLDRSTVIPLVTGPSDASRAAR
jgi:hypothetical protein